MTRKARTVRHLSVMLSWLVVLSLLGAACSTPPASPTPVPATPTESGPVLSGIHPDPQRIEFQTEDNKMLVGYYYPSKYAKSPVLILMHWARGDLCDWSDIALWLQNRADEHPAKIERCAKTQGHPWRDPSWFPGMDSDTSLAVFVFDFRGYGESEVGSIGEDMLKDARAAFKTVAGLKGVDPARMASLGTSIGADGAADGCLLYNQEAGSGCVGAFSLSPGGYLGMPYDKVITDLAPIASLCASSEGDVDSARACTSVDRQHYAKQIYKGAAHGMALFAPDVDPSPLELTQVFIGLAFGEDVQKK